MEASLVMFKSDGERREFPLTKPRVVVGRKNTCDLRIPLSSVSRQHCQIEVREEGLFLRDLGSSNGTYYNSRRVQETPLKPGDQIMIGPVHFTVVIDGQPAKIEPVKTVVPSGNGNGRQSAMETMEAIESELGLEGSGERPAWPTEDESGSMPTLDEEDQDDYLMFEDDEGKR